MPKGDDKRVFMVTFGLGIELAKIVVGEYGITGYSLLGNDILSRFRAKLNISSNYSIWRECQRKISSESSVLRSTA